MLKIGFDFDGVLVYNPLRVARLPVALFKSKFMKKRRLKFWYPKQSWQKQFWILAHKSSVFPAKGYRRLQKLLRRRKIKGYVITARYSFLEADFNAWLDRHDPARLFAGYFLNERNEQPHKFKERMIKELNLDHFVEDNWDIVNYLSGRLNSSSSKLKAESSKQIPRPENDRPNHLAMREQSERQPFNPVSIHWIYNLLDRNIDYSNKHPYLGKFLDSIGQ